MREKYLSIVMFSIVVLLTFNFCSKGDERKEEKSVKTEIQNTTGKLSTTEGYKLMEQKCFICHFAKPDPSKRNSMIAPPMIRVQQHYKPTYPDKKDFINAILAWVKNPTKENTLMPGAVRKFNVMPHLGYSDNEIKLIAGTLYDIDFGKAPKMGMRMYNGMQLNNGKKWKLHGNTIKLINSLTNKLENFRSGNIEEYNTLGKEIFNKAKTILLDKSYSKNIFEQLHIFFNDIEENIHTLISTKDLDEAKKQQLLLLNKFIKFHNYFE